MFFHSCPRWSNLRSLAPCFLLLSLCVLFQPAFAAPAVVMPAIANFSPSSGYPGDATQINGSGFGKTPGQVIFGNVTLNPSSLDWTDTSIQIRIPRLPAMAYQVIVATRGLKSAAQSFTITAPPQLTDSPPLSAPAGK